MLRSTTLHVVLITCLLISGAAHASVVYYNDSTFGGFSFGSAQYEDIYSPMVGFMGGYDSPLLGHEGFGVVGIANFGLTPHPVTERHAYTFSAMFNYSDFYDNGILHMGVGVAFNEWADRDFKPCLALSASYTYNLGVFNTEQIALDLGVQWVRERGIAFTISPGFWAE